jgi:hypothetical protein
MYIHCDRVSVPGPASPPFGQYESWVILGSSRSSPHQPPIRHANAALDPPLCVMCSVAASSCVPSRPLINHVLRPQDAPPGESGYGRLGGKGPETGQNTVDRTSTPIRRGHGFAVCTELVCPVPERPRHIDLSTEEPVSTEVCQCQVRSRAGAQRAENAVSPTMTGASKEHDLLHKLSSRSIGAVLWPSSEI